MAPELELRGIVKRYPGVVANDDVSLAVDKGEIRAIVGENGAGKTTLMSILYGLVQPDEGEILLRGDPVRFSSPLDAIAAGLGMVHQSFMLFGSLSVTDNVVYGSEPTTAGFVDRSEAAQRVARLAGEHGLRVDPKAIVASLPVGVRQRVEILKALYRDADVLILDEPTAVLTPQERDALFGVLRSLAAGGTTILLITHKLHEVMSLSDNATVLRDGRVTAHLRTADTTPREITRHMTGRDVVLTVDRTPATASEPVLEVEDLHAVDGEGRTVVRDVSLRVGAGEIVGVAGVAGNGQTELVEALVGLRAVARGRVALRGRDVTDAGVAQRRDAGLAYIPEDRWHVGTAPAADLEGNLAMGFQHTPEMTRGRLLRRDRMRDHARGLIERFGIRASSAAVRAGALSGGNLQKVVVARELAHDAPLLIAEQPTRGVDVGAIEFVHRQLVAYRDAGHAILLVSAELSEVMALSDRILVMYEGRVVADLDGADATEAGLGLLMAGAGAAAGGGAVTVGG